MSLFLDMFDKPKLSPIKTGADIDAKNNEGRTALMIAASENAKPEILSVLIEAGADVNAKDNEGNTPMSIALRREPQQAEIVEVLQKAGAVPPDGL